MIEGILVFTQEPVLQHKLKDGFRKDEAWCYWETTRFPKKFLPHLKETSLNRYKPTEDLRIYFAVKGKVRGYFPVAQVAMVGKWKAIEFHSEDWVEIKDGEQFSPSQGWRYYIHGQENI